MARRLYAPECYPAVAHHQVIQAAVKAAAELGIRHHVGVTRTADTFYAGHARPGSSFGGFWQSAWRDHFDDLSRLNVLAGEMEASIVLVLARIWGLRGADLAVVLDDIRTVSGEPGVFDPESQFDHSDEYIARLAELGNETLRLLHAADNS
jgi:uridine phosphorylase